LITGNTVNGNTGVGIDLADGSTVTGNTLRGNSGVALYLGVSGYGNNVLTANNNNGVQVSGGIQLGPNVCNFGPCP
jgi:parallel beta-helix repeat protein